MTLIRDNRRYINKSRDLRVVPSLADDHAGPGMSDKDYGALLHGNRPLGCRDVIGQRGKWILDSGYMQTLRFK